MRISKIAWAIILSTLVLMGCGADFGSTATSTGPQSVAQPEVNAGSYPARIVSEVPLGAVQLRFLGANVEGEEVLNTLQPTATSVTVDLDPGITTLRLEYLDSAGRILATFVESAKNLLQHDFRDGLIDPALVSLAAPQLLAKASDNPVVGADIKFSFAFFGSNETLVPSRDEEGQLNQTERYSTANVAQLRQHLADIGTLQPKPKFVFLCGDLVHSPPVAGPPSQAALEKAMRAWHKIRASGPIIIDANGAEQTVTPPGDGSVFPFDITLVAVPGDQEMCAGGLPNKLGGEVFVTQMARYIRGNNGPKPGDQLDDGGLGLPADNVQRDESRLSYTFRAAAGGSSQADGEYLFMVLNTDTYVGEGAANVGRIPLRWIRQQLSDAQQNPGIKHIFVFGHRPILSIYDAVGIQSEVEAKQFYRLLNNPTASNPNELKISNPDTKVRGYFCAHAHLMSSLQPDPNGTVQQLVCGSGGSQPDPTNVAGVEPYPWFGFGLVGVTQDEAVDAAFIGRNVHRSWADQEALKLRGPNISGPGLAEAKTPKRVARLYPQPLALRTSLGASTSATYSKTFESTFTELNQPNNSVWQAEEFRDPASSPVEYKKENVEPIPGGGVRIKVAGKHYSESKKKWYIYSGRLRSNFRQKYGLFLFRARIPKGAHLWPALWTAGSVGGNDIWPKTGEIDVMETVLPVNARPDFTSRIMVRTDQPDFPNYKDYLGNPWYASLPPDDSREIKTSLTVEQWAQPHTFAVDWYKVMTGDVLTDVRYDFYLDVKVDADGRLVNAFDESLPPTRLHSYSLRDLINKQNQKNPKIPKLETVVSEWSKQAFVLNVAVSGAWDPDLKKVEKGEWDPPTDGSAEMLVEWVQCYQRSDQL